MNKIFDSYPVTNILNNTPQTSQVTDPDLFAYILNNSLSKEDTSTQSIANAIELNSYNSALNSLNALGNTSNAPQAYSNTQNSSPMDLLGMSNSGSDEQIIIMLLLMLLQKQDGGNNLNSLATQLNSGNTDANYTYPSNISQQVINDAKSMINTKYSQTDCSDLIELVFKKSGIDFANSPHGTTAAGIAKYVDTTNQTVTKEQLQPGDLIFWQKNGCNCGRYQEIHHVGIYLNENTILDSLPKGGVQVREMWGQDGDPWHVVKYGRPTQPL